MRKITLSLVSLLALSGVAFAQGDTADKAIWEPASSAIYGGLGYGFFDQSVKGIEYPGAQSFSLGAHTVMFQGGYQYNPYISVEARYWLGVTDIVQKRGEAPGAYAGDLDVWGVYVKPTLPVTDGFNLYMLLGYSSNSTSYQSNNWDTSGFSWGVGLDMDATNNFSVFVDYVNLTKLDSFDYTNQNGSEVPDVAANINAYTFNMGVNYKFALN